MVWHLGGACVPSICISDGDRGSEDMVMISGKRWEIRINE